ncbi:hypothetical protein HanPI659440_Chr01g0027181 [Helianthus annuus]|nr:hypothetical protein HanPI659440_Chr01g0027181 [Helianthus annuus]
MSRELFIKNLPCSLELYQLKQVFWIRCERSSRSHHQEDVLDYRYSHMYLSLMF